MRKTAAEKLEWRRRYQATPEFKARGYNTRAKYGITPAQKIAIFVAQGERCGLCGGTEPHSRMGWTVDHDHFTGVVRGVLCHYCNGMLGMAAKAAGTEDPASLEPLLGPRALSYLIMGRLIVARTLGFVPKAKILCR